MSLKFKSFAALALSAAMMFSVAACGTTDSGDAKSDSKANCLLYTSDAADE